MEIDAKGYPLREILTKNISYEIPDYQRPYSWKKEHIDDLFSDIYFAMECENNHFLGTVVFNSERKENDKVLEVIDGQQRLTTIMLILYVIRRFYKEKIFDDEKGINSRRSNIQNLLEFSDDDGDIIGLKLNLGEVNREFFKDYIVNGWDKDAEYIEDIKNKFKNRGELEVNNTIIKAYDHIYSVIKNEINYKEEFSEETKKSYDKLKKINEAILDKLEVVKIEVKNDVDAFLIFETLNERGLELSVVDLIKNKLFKNCANKDDFNQLKSKWREIISTIEESDELRNFIRHYWISKHNFVTTQDLFKDIKGYIGKDYDKSKIMIDDLNKLAKYYKIFMEPSEKFIKNSALIDVLKETKKLKFNSHFPILISALEKYDFKVDDQEFYKVSKLCLNFLVRYITVLKRKPTVIEKVFGEIAREFSINKLYEKFIMYAKDNEFQNALEIIEVKQRSDATHYLLTQYEKSLHENEQWIAPERKSVTIEHILPQTIKQSEVSGQKWLEIFGGKDECEKYLNRLGNLTLLGPKAQSKTSNKFFDKKQDVYKEYTDMLMTKELLEYSNWGIEEIEKRQKEMAKKFVEIFTLDIEKL
ncbi:DUF262 domain-containing protein [Clostridium perfringens]|uniref:DUF262 domain-containing protein n=1 Tax=Clostridium perfringens TaxID=1502 RepID=A0AAW9I400_CLOPF|nr:DUF262 domain-containing HNH endonuclease family protein [Clostridium perfringens]MDZ4908660.1 DUF262 domain-containing protein [Clostridium perfringens]